MDLDDPQLEALYGLDDDTLARSSEIPRPILSMVAAFVTPEAIAAIDDRRIDALAKIDVNKATEIRSLCSLSGIRGKKRFDRNFLVALAEAVELSVADLATFALAPTVASFEPEAQARYQRSRRGYARVGGSEPSGATTEPEGAGAGTRTRQPRRVRRGLGGGIARTEPG